MSSSMNKTSDPVIDRSFLRFAEEVRNRFAFLEEQSFCCVQSCDTYVRFESSRFAIDIYHGRLSYEIGLEIESLPEPESYSLYAILRLVDREHAERYRSFATHSVEGVSIGVCQLAEIFKKCLASGIFDDSQLFSKLKLQCEKLKHDYALDIQLQQSRSKAENAWHRKDY